MGARPLVTTPGATSTVRERVWPINVNKGLFLLRAVVGLLFIGHATQKLFGWFGGDGLAKTTESFAKLGIQPATLWAPLEAGAELSGGLFLVLGLLTPIGAALIIGDMLVAIVKVHAPKGLWSQQGGFEYNLVLIAILLVIGLAGPGLYSLDRRLPFALPRPWTFAFALVITIGVSLLALR
jgi:putative oxidoreductase